MAFNAIFTSGKGRGKKKNSIEKKDDSREREEKGIRRGEGGIELPCIAK